ncbi:unnamed protein product, partial [Mesorhabditis spiculigera]
MALQRDRYGFELEHQFHDPPESDSDEAANFLEYENYGEEPLLRGLEETIHRLAKEREVERLFETIRREKAVTFEAPQPTLQPGDKPGVALRLTEHAMKYLKQKFLAVLRHDLIRSHPPRLEASILGANLTVDEVQVADFQAPMISTELRGQYLNIFRTTRQGQFEAELTGLDVELKLKFLKTFEGRLKETLTRRVQAAVCPAFDASLKNFEENLPQLAHFLNPLSTAKHFSQDVSFDTRLTAEPEVASSYAQLAIRGEFSSNRTTIEEKPHHLATSPSDIERMAYTYISDHTVSTFLRQLSTFGDVRFNLHVLPEIADFLRPSCAKFEPCIGHYAQLDGVNAASGRLVVRSRASPKVRFHPGHAAIRLKTTVELSYRPQDDLFTEDTLYAQFDAEVVLKLTKLLIRRGRAPGTYEWSARVHILETTVSNGVAVKPVMDKFIGNLQSIMDKSTEYLEAILSTHLGSLLPVELSKHVELDKIEPEFRDRTLAVGFDFEMDAQLFPRLQHA